MPNDSCWPYPVDKRKITYEKLLNSYIDQDKITDCFWWVRGVADNSREKIRLVCTLSYLIGIFMLGVVLFENIKYVVGQINL